MNLLEQLKAFLKSQGLEDTQVDTIANGLAGAKIHLSAEEKIDERYTKLKGQNELLDKQLKAANDTIETLKKDNGSNEDLLNEVQKYKDDNKALQDKYDKDVVEVEKKQLVINALTKEGAVHPDLLVASMDLSKVELKDGKISGHKDLFKDLKESYKDQFKEVDPEDGGDDKGGYQYVPAGGDDKGGKGDVDVIGAMQAYSVHK
ncbi:hypothetical protein EOM57_01075 [Candidatus Saccharibacteria bacterium]|nr:hypothetical protein [Candidatus Saccharibacteria bacterium]